MLLKRLDARTLAAAAAIKTAATSRTGTSTIDGRPEGQKPPSVGRAWVVDTIDAALFGGGI
jgi:hypothetical protein